MMAHGTSCVSFAPLSSLPLYDPSESDQPHDVFCVLSMGPPFQYIIPSFDTLAVPLRQMRIKGNYKGQEEVKVYDLFIINDTSLNGTVWPTVMEVKDSLVIPVRL